MSKCFRELSPYPSCELLLGAIIWLRLSAAARSRGAPCLAWHMARKATFGSDSNMSKPLAISMLEASWAALPGFMGYMGPLSTAKHRHGDRIHPVHRSGCAGLAFLLTCQAGKVRRLECSEGSGNAFPSRFPGLGCPGLSGGGRNEPAALDAEWPISGLHGLPFGEFQTFDRSP